MIYKFPFEKIEKGSKIILYGMGDVGKQYLAQCRESNYCSVLFGVDALSNLFYTKAHEISVYQAEKIKELKDTDYDYIVISIRDEKISQYIRSTLLEFGVKGEKIIHSIIAYQPLKCLGSPEIRQWYKSSFSWYGEDLIVKGIFQSLGIEKPSYLDVGCNHPYEGNNTALLYLTGSIGINIDANQNCIDLMNQERPDDTNLCIGVMPERGKKTFYLLSEYDALNSFSKEYIDQYTARHQFQSYEGVGNVPIECFQLSDVISQYCGEGFPDYLDLDIEGLDCDVILSYEFTDNGPMVMAVESHEKRLYDYLLGQGYVRYFETPHNSIFIRRELLKKVLLM